MEGGGILGVSPRPNLLVLWLLQDIPAAWRAGQRRTELLRLYF